MKKTFILAAVLTLSIQAFTVAPASANAVETVSKASKITSFLNKFADWRFFAVIGPVMLTFNDTIAPSWGRGLCAIERNTVGRGAVLSKDLDRRCYGDPTVNSCMVANNTVALMVQIGASSENAIRFQGKFDGGNKLMEITQFFVKVDAKKNVTPLAEPIIASIDSRGLTERVALSPGEIIDRSDSEEKATFAHYDRLASVMKLAFSECSEGKYDAMLKKVVDQQGKQTTSTIETKK